MKHYTSTELIDKMDFIGYWFDTNSSRRGHLVFCGTDDGWTVYPLSFSTWQEVAKFYVDYMRDL